MNPTQSRFRTHLASLSLVVAGVVGGGLLTSTLVASAADPTPSTVTSSAAASTIADAPDRSDRSRPMRSDEELLTGDAKSKVETAVLATYAGATIERTESDSGGVYESHVVTADGERLTVLVDADFAVTGTDDHGPR